MRNIDLLRETYLLPTAHDPGWTRAKNTLGYGKLRADGEYLYTHRIACELANGPAPTDAPYATHACTNRACYFGPHLSWASPAQNSADMIRDGTSTRGERDARAALTKADVLVIRQRHDAGESQHALARAFGVSPATINRAVRRQSWTHV
jgi:hypothetical protein